MAKIGSEYYLGKNYYFYGTVGNNRVMVGCAKDYTRGASGDLQDVSCQGSGSQREYFPAVLVDNELSFNGIRKLYSETEDDTNIAVDTFWNNLTAGTTMEVFFGKDFSATKVVEKGVFVVSSVSYQGKIDGYETYSVSGKISGGWQPYTIPA